MKPAAEHLRVLQVIAGLDPSIGGPPASAIQTALALRGEGLVNEFTFVHDGEVSAGAARNVGMLEEAEIAVHGFAVSPLLGRGAWRWGVSGRAALWLLRSARRFDVLHMHGAWTFTTLAGLAAARLWRRAAVLSTHESLTDYDRAKSPPVRRLLKRALRGVYLRSFDRVVVSSRLEQLDSGDREARRSVVVPHAVLAPAGAGKAVRRPEALVVGFLGRLHPKKNLDVVIRAVAACDRDAELVVAGDGAERERLERLARECGIADRVTWLGFVDPVAKAEFLGSIDVLAMPSAYECFGVAAAEALGAGVPAIVSPTVGVADVVARHDCGIVVAPEPDALADAFRELASDPVRLRRIAQATRDVVDREFSLERHGRRLHEEYLRAEIRRHHLPPAPASMPGALRPPAVSVIVATLDEELHVERVVRSAASLGPVYVVDAGSTDRTQELATAAGAVVVEHEWTGYAAQKNWALDNLPLGTDWVLFLDADEYLTPALAEEIRAAVEHDDVDGLYLPEMNVFMGRPLKHAWWYPAYQLRLFRRAKGRYEDRAVHESVVVGGRLDFLTETLYHESLKGLDAFMQRHLRYATFEAAEMLRAEREGWGTQRRGRLLGTWPERRRFLKVRVWYRLPFRPAIRFLWIYVVKRGFLDGRPGLVYASLLAMYESLINAKLAELRRSDEPPAPLIGSTSGEEAA